MKNKQLLCTFTTSKEYDAVILEIKNFYSVINGKIFLLCNVNNPKELYATYNVDLTDGNSMKFHNTISVHRKKETNTLYNMIQRFIDEHAIDAAPPEVQRHRQADRAGTGDQDRLAAHGIFML